MSPMDQNLYIFLAVTCIILGTYWAVRSVWRWRQNRPRLLSKAETVAAAWATCFEGDADIIRYQRLEAKAANARKGNIMKGITWTTKVGGNFVAYSLDARIIKGGDYNHATIEITNARVMYVNGFLPTGSDQELYGEFDFPETEALEFLSELPAEEWDVLPDSEFEGVG